MSASDPQYPLSVYRGQSRLGIAEGPGTNVPQGEQYLDAEGFLQQDGALLREIRPWMTLDSDPADHQKLDDRLEAWSLFPAGDHLFVTRLVSAGIYSRRAAYFAHGRAWLQNDLSNGLDPGMLLGRSEAFEKPWRDQEPGTHQPQPIPEEAYKVSAPDEPEIVVRFLGSLFQAMVERRQIVVAAPVAEFAVGKPLAARLALARAALPSSFKRYCRIRVYTQTPELFLSELKAHLVVVPDALTGDALGVRRDAILLDCHGNCHSRNFEIDQRVAYYSKIVLENAGQVPGGLVPFSERFSRCRLDNTIRPLKKADLLGLEILYYVAYGLAGSVKRRALLLNNYLFKAAQQGDLDWNELVGVEEWKNFPADALAEFLLRTDSFENPGQQAFQEAAAQALRSQKGEFSAALCRTLEQQLRDWFDDDTHKHKRLLSLVASGLVPYPEVTGDYLRSIPIEAIDEAGLSARVLEEETRNGWIADRRQESAQLASLARREVKHAEILAEATTKGSLTPEWAALLLEEPVNREALVALAEHLLPHQERWQAWERFPHQLVDELLTLAEAPPRLRDVIDRAGQNVDPEEDFASLLRLAELRVRLFEDLGTLAEKLFTEFQRIKNPDNQEVVLRYVLDPNWRSLQVSHLSRKNGELRWLWLKDHAKSLISIPEVRTALTTEALLGLLLEPSPLDDELLEPFFETIDERMESHPEETTRALVRHGWWTGWRRRLPDDRNPESHALNWLRCSAWSVATPPEAQLETWNQVVEDLGQRGISAEEMRSLCNGGKHTWPWIPPFEREQAKALAGLAQSLGALVELAAGLPVHRVPLGKTEPLGRFLYQGSRAEQHDTEGASEVPIWLLSSAGLMHDQRRSSNPAFLEKLAKWLAKWRSVSEIGGDSNGEKIAEIVNSNIELSSHRESPRRSPELAAELLQKGFQQAAELLCPGISGISGISVVSGPRESMGLVDRLLQALCSGKEEEPFWDELDKLIEARSATDLHPLSRLANELRGKGPSDQQLQRLRDVGWPTFRAVVAKRSRFLSYPPADNLTPLPALDLMAGLLPGEMIPKVVEGFVFSPGSVPYRNAKSWWMFLLEGVRKSPSLSRLNRGESRPLQILAVVLTSVEKLGAKELEAFFGALVEMAPDWPELRRPVRHWYGT